MHPVPVRTSLGHEEGNGSFFLEVASAESVRSEEEGTGAIGGVKHALDVTKSSFWQVSLTGQPGI